MVRTDHGSAVANALARRLVVAPRRAGGQAQFIETPVPEGPREDLGELLSWALANLDRPISVTDLARRSNISVRHLSRRFLAATGTTPLRWLLAQRVRRAQELLEHTNGPIERIAEQTGMGTAATLRRQFQQVVGAPPATYRRTFRGGHNPHRTP